MKKWILRKLGAALCPYVFAAIQAADPCDWEPIRWEPRAEGAGVEPADPRRDRTG
jgi:hypothetical protein